VRFRLVPTDDRFFELFNESAQNAAACAVALREVLRSPSSTAALDQVIACERRGDALTADILHRLDTSFVTPFDREDIHALAEEIDDVVDDMYQAGELVGVVGITEPLAEILQQADLLVAAAEQNIGLVEKLQGMRDGKPMLDAIDQLETQGDAVHRQALARLFSGEFEALDVLKWKDLVQAMETTLNGLEDVSDVIESIILKHA
jgi:predicted phosphate transport protein (TIGR00153 family)